MMTIKHLRVYAILFVLFANGTALAQTATNPPAAGTALHQASDRFQADMILVRDRYADLLTGYLTAYRAGTVSKQMAIQSDVLQIKRKHLKNFRKALPPRKAARFYQLENKMDPELESQLAAIVPLIDPV